MGLDPNVSLTLVVGSLYIVLRLYVHGYLVGKHLYFVDVVGHWLNCVRIRLVLEVCAGLAHQERELLGLPVGSLPADLDGLGAFGLECDSRIFLVLCTIKFLVILGRTEGDSVFVLTSDDKLHFNLGVNRFGRHLEAVGSWLLHQHGDAINLWHGRN